VCGVDVSTTPDKTAVLVLLQLEKGVRIMAIQKNTAKAVAKPVVKAAVKPVVKAPTKSAVTPAKVPAKVPVKAPAKTAKASAEVSGKVGAKVGRKELAQAIVDAVKATGKAVPLTIADMAVVAMEETIAATLYAGGEVVLPGFGKFTVTHKEAGMARNPTTGEQVKTMAKNVMKFRAGSKLKEAINA